jgi:hypothetical protein
MQLFTVNDLKKLMADEKSTCVSIYLPTVRSASEARQNVIRLKNLLKKAETSLVGQGLRRDEIESIINPGRGLLDDIKLWDNREDGLAVFLSTRNYHYYHLPASVDELVVVGPRFHIKPLFHLLSGDVNYFVLALSQNQIRLIKCTQYTAAEVELTGLPTSMDDALQYDGFEKHLQARTGMSGGGRRPALFHGQGPSREQTKDDLVKFFRQVDSGLQKYFKNSQAPLVLAGVDYLGPLYREVNTYGFLEPQGLAGNPEELPLRDLQTRAWPLVKPWFEKALSEDLAEYRQLDGTGRTSRQVEEIVAAAHHGRVKTIFVPVGRQNWGTYDQAGSAPEVHQQFQDGDVDLLDLAAAQAILNGGGIHVMIPDEMPDQAEIAAIYRY